MLIILAIALIVFGPNKLPELARAFGKAMREFRKATEEVKESFRDETKDLEEIKSNLNQENLLEDLARHIETPSEPPVSPEPSSESVVPELSPVSAEPVPESGKTMGDASPGENPPPAKDSPPFGGNGPAGEGLKDGKEGMSPHGRG